MRASPPPANIPRIVRQIELSWGIDRIRAANPSWSEANEETCGAILNGAAEFAAGELESLNASMDSHGCTLEDGQVRTAPGHRETWSKYITQGWPTLEAPTDWGGQGLPAILAFAAQEQFDRACPAFGMLPVPQRSAFRLIRAFGETALQQEWLPRLAAGDWGATICVSEAGAGSDLSRVSTRATPAGKDWVISGEKCWISFGNHDLSKQIGHVVLAQADAPNTRGPSLFLVPSLLPDGNLNAVAVRRLEHKMGLHGSPTCALGFEGAHAILLGELGRGLPQMFVMIANMRLAVGAMGLGIASGASAIAMQYAEERRQGGRPGPVAIVEHPDVQLQLVRMGTRVELLRGLLFTAANANDLSLNGDDLAGDLATWLLPIVKTTGGEIAFDVASEAMQVLGGAGYTKEWPIEQGLRDARVLTIFEGTTGIQAQDLMHRRLISDQRAFRAFLSVCSSERSAEPRFDVCVSELENAATWLLANTSAADAAATAFLHLAAQTALGWIAARYATSERGSFLAVVAEAYLNDAPANVARLASMIYRNSASVACYAAIREGELS